MSSKTKRAVLVGINYYGTSNELRGCVNDIMNAKEAYRELGVPDENIVELYDVPAGETLPPGVLLPTAANILASFGAAVTASKTGDCIYIHYSGHGTYTIDTSGDERDGRDEMICALDENIIDDLLNKILVQNLPEGVKLRCVFDCCHSGSSLDLSCRYTHNGTFVMEQYNTSDKDVIYVSGCRDEQTSADAYEANEQGNNIFQGAMTWAWLKSRKYAQKYNKRMTWKEFVQTMRHYLLKQGYDQVPQLGMCSRTHLLRRVDIF